MPMPPTRTHYESIDTDPDNDENDTDYNGYGHQENDGIDINGLTISSYHLLPGTSEILVRSSALHMRYTATSRRNSPVWRSNYLSLALIFTTSVQGAQ
jgi:hypothetical protein